MTVPSDAQIANYCAMIYEPNAVISFDHFDAGIDDGVCWALKKLPGFDLIIFRGSITFQDWWRDLMAAIAIPSRIGTVDVGFYSGMEKVWPEALPMISQPVIVSGHSLGAARADLLVALMTVDGKPPISRVVFGEPKPGLVDLATIIEDIPASSYRNGDRTHHDIVTDVPSTFPPVQRVHPTPIVPVSEEPTGGLFATWGIFAYHHITLYETAVATLGRTTTPQGK